MPETQQIPPQEPPRKGLWQLWLFLALSLLVSWAIWLSPLDGPGLIHIVLFGLRFSFPSILIKLLLGNCIPGVLAIAFSLSAGKQKLLQLLSALLHWRVPPKWYFLALVLPFGISWVSLGVVSLYFPTPRTLPSLVRLAIYLVLTLPFGPLWGELAWRGYALRKLQSRYSQLTSSLMLGLYWAVWLIPLWVTTHGASHTRAQELVAAVTTIVAWSVVYTSLFNRSGQSLPVVILLEAAHVASVDEIYATVQVGQLLFIWLSAGLTVFLAAIFAMRMVGDSSSGDSGPTRLAG